MKRIHTKICSSCENEIHDSGYFLVGITILDSGIPINIYMCNDCIEAQLEDDDKQGNDVVES